MTPGTTGLPCPTSATAPGQVWARLAACSRGRARAGLPIPSWGRGQGVGLGKGGRRELCAEAALDVAPSLLHPQHHLTQHPVLHAEGPAESGPLRTRTPPHGSWSPAGQAEGCSRKSSDLQDRPSVSIPGCGAWACRAPYLCAVAGVLVGAHNLELVEHLAHDDDAGPHSGQAGGHGPEAGIGQGEGPQHQEQQVHHRHLWAGGAGGAGTALPCPVGPLCPQGPSGCCRHGQWVCGCSPLSGPPRQCTGPPA